VKGFSCVSTHQLRSLILLLGLCAGASVSPPSFAQARGDKKNNYIYLHNKRLNKKKFEDKFPNATVLTPGEQLAAKRKETLSLPRQAQFFRRAGLRKYIKGMDQLEKDQLVLSIRHLPLSKLAKKYQKIPKPILAKARKNLRKETKKR